MSFPNAIMLAALNRALADSAAGGSQQANKAQITQRTNLRRIGDESLTQYAVAGGFFMGVDTILIGFMLITNSSGLDIDVQFPSAAIIVGAVDGASANDVLKLTVINRSTVAGSTVSFTVAAGSGNTLNGTAGDPIPIGTARDFFIRLKSPFVGMEDVQIY